MSPSKDQGDGKGPRWVGDDLPDLPPELEHAQKLPPKVTDTHVLFFGFEGPEPECCLQQWYPSPFTEPADVRNAGDAHRADDIDPDSAEQPGFPQSSPDMAPGATLAENVDTPSTALNRFATSEQYMMYHKARLMGDEAIAEKILAATTPAEAKALGRSVSDFDQAKWDAHMDRIVEEGNFAKFSQNEGLKQVLLGTGEREIVETSPNDRLWGIGFNSDDALDHVDEWGENRLGKALMRVRERLRNIPLPLN